MGRLLPGRNRLGALFGVDILIRESELESELLKFIGSSALVLGMNGPTTLDLVEWDTSVLNGAEAVRSNYIDMSIKLHLREA